MIFFCVSECDAKNKFPQFSENMYEKNVIVVKAVIVNFGCLWDMADNSTKIDRNMLWGVLVNIRSAQKP